MNNQPKINQKITMSNPETGLIFIRGEGWRPRREIEGLILELEEMTREDNLQVTITEDIRKVLIQRKEELERELNGARMLNPRVLNLSIIKNQQEIKYAICGYQECKSKNECIFPGERLRCRWSGMKAEKIERERKSKEVDVDEAMEVL